MCECECFDCSCSWRLFSYRLVYPLTCNCALKQATHMLLVPASALYASATTTNNHLATQCTVEKSIFRVKGYFASNLYAYNNNNSKNGNQRWKQKNTNKSAITVNVSMCVFCAVQKWGVSEKCVTCWRILFDCATTRTLTHL